MRCVVVTGMSAVTPLGSDLSTTWQGLINGKSGITRIPNSMFVTDDLAVKIAGIVGTNGDLDLNQYVSAKEQRKMDRFIHLAIVASVQAIRDSGWEPSNDRERYRTGVLIGSGIGGLIAIEQNSITLHNEGPKKISPFFIPASLINLASGRVAIMYNFKGPNHAVVTACATGSHAIGDAARIIADGDADVMVCGGTEAAICRLGIAGFAAARALSTRNDAPEKASRPWDKDRDGFVMGDRKSVV